MNSALPLLNQRITIFLTLILFLIISPCIFPVNGQLIKYSSNPIIKVDFNKKWKSAHVSSPFVLYENGIYKMWYGAHDGIGWKIAYATSNDGLNWSDYNINPVLLPSYDGFENHVHTPRVVKTNTNRYLLYYTASPDDMSNFEIRLAESQDGINWVKNNSFHLTKTQSWETWGLVSPMVLKDNNGFHMWYDSHEGNYWKIGYATSSDGLNWFKYLNNPLTIMLGNADGSFFVSNKDGEILKGWRHGGTNLPTSIYSVESSDYINWTNMTNVLEHGSNNDFDSLMITGPSVIDINNNLFLYYSGFDGAHWQIGVATEGDPPQAKKTPIVIVPGFMASWNKEALFYNNPVPNSDWIIPKFSHEFDGLKQTLAGLGYNEGSDFIMFPYDWRKPIEQSSEELKQFVAEKYPGENKINIVGHSLGGLVGRLFAQKNSGKINRLVTAGSPHAGTALTYKALEGGELEKNNSMMWLAQKMILALAKRSDESEKDTLQRIVPSLYDIFPVSGFLKNETGEVIPVQTMSLRNSTLDLYNQSLSDIFPLLQTLAGNTHDTLSGYTVTQPNRLDKLLGLYPDGRPVTAIIDPGDGVITENSALAGNDGLSIGADHHELIYKNEGVAKILNGLGIQASSDHIREGTQTKVSPALIFLMLSPATMTVNSGSSQYIEDNGIIYISDAQKGNYELDITCLQNGNYHVIMGQIGTGTDRWSRISKNITGCTTPKVVDSFNIAFNPFRPDYFPVTFNGPQQLIDLILEELKLYVNYRSDYGLAGTASCLEREKTVLLRHTGDNENITECYNKFFGSTVVTDVLFPSTLSKFETLYSIVAQTDGKTVFENRNILMQIQSLQNRLQNLAKPEDKQLQSIQLSSFTKQEALYLSEAGKKIEEAAEWLDENNYSLSRILLDSAKKYLQLGNFSELTN